MIGLVYVGMGPFFTVLLGRYIVQNPEQHLMNEIQPKSIRTLKIPEFYSEYREKGEGYAAFLGSSITAKVGPPTNIPRYFSDGGCDSFGKGHVPRVANQELREQSRVRRKWTVSDHWNVSGVVVATTMSRTSFPLPDISTPLCDVM